MVTRLVSGETRNRCDAAPDCVAAIGSTDALSTEASFLIATVRRFLDPAAPVPDGAPGDPAILTRLAIDHAVAPMAYRALRDSASDLAEHLRPICESGALASLRLAAELCTLSDLQATLPRTNSKH